MRHLCKGRPGGQRSRPVSTCCLSARLLSPPILSLSTSATALLRPTSEEDHPHACRWFVSCSINMQAYCETSFSPSATRFDRKGHFSTQTQNSPPACVQDCKAPSPANSFPTNLLYQPPHTTSQWLSHFSQHQKHPEGC